MTGFAIQVLNMQLSSICHTVSNLKWGHWPSSVSIYIKQLQVYIVWAGSLSCKLPFFFFAITPSKSKFLQKVQTQVGIGSKGGKPMLKDLLAQVMVGNSANTYYRVEL